MPKNAQTTTQLHSSHTLVKLKILQARLQQYMNHELPDVQAGFKKGRGNKENKGKDESFSDLWNYIKMSNI